MIQYYRLRICYFDYFNFDYFNFDYVYIVLYTSKKKKKKAKRKRVVILDELKEI